MKVVFFSLLLLGTVASAEVKPLGTFVASECSKPNPSGTICFGIKEGTRGVYLFVAETRTAGDVYLVVKRIPHNAGINPQFSDETLVLVNGSGQKATAEVTQGLQKAVSVTLPDGAKVYGSEFKVMMHTM